MTKNLIDIYVYYKVPINLCDIHLPIIQKLLSTVSQIYHIETDLQQRIEVASSTNHVTWLEVYKKVTKVEIWREAVIKASADIDPALIENIRRNAHEEYFYSLLTPNIQSTKH